MIEKDIKNSTGLSRNKDVNLCSKCKEQMDDDKQSYCKSCRSIYDSERYEKSKSLNLFHKKQEI